MSNVSSAFEIPELHGNKVILRPWNIKFASEVAENANNINVARYLLPHFPHPYSLKDAENYLTVYTDNHAQSSISGDGVSLAITVQKETAFPFIGCQVEKIINNEMNNFDKEYDVIGGIGIHFNDLNDHGKYNGTIGYWIGEKYWRKGFTFDSIKTILEFIWRGQFNELTGIFVTCICASIFEENIASMKVLEKLNFEKIGPENKYLDRFNNYVTSILYVMTYDRYLHTFK